MTKPPKFYNFEGWQFDVYNGELLAHNHKEPLTATESKVLNFLIESRPNFCTGDDILNGAWGADVFVRVSSVYTAITIIRKRIELLPLNLDSEKIIENQKGKGYRFTIHPIVTEQSLQTTLALQDRESEIGSANIILPESAEYGPIALEQHSSQIPPAVLEGDCDAVLDATSENEVVAEQKDLIILPGPKGQNSDAEIEKCNGSERLVTVLTEKYSPLIYSALVKAILLSFALLAVNWLEKRTVLGRSMESATYNILMHRLSSKFNGNDLPIAIVDIGDLPQHSGTGNENPYTSRHVLQEFVTAAIGNGARSVGIDLDFSPDKGDYITPDDPKFFESCLELKRTTGVPIFLGIYRSQSKEASTWLGDERYKELAATIITPRDGTRMLRWLRTTNNTEPSFSISALLAGTTKNPIPERSSRWAWAIQSEQDVKQHYFSGKEFLVDYSPLNVLEKQMLPTRDPAVIRDQARRLQGKIVLFGDVTSGRTRDTIVVPGIRDPVPGALVHACAVYTLLKAPLYSLTFFGHLAIDLIIPLVIFGVIATIQIVSRKRNALLSNKLQTFILCLTAMIVIGVGWGFVDVTRIIWNDFFLVAAVLLAYGPVERGLRYLRHTAAYSWRMTSTSQAEGN